MFLIRTILLRTYIHWDIYFTGSTKLFPLVVTYFDINEGIKHRLLDFYEDDYESSEAIYQRILNILNDKHLDTNKISAFSADNANVNYGKNNSVFQKLTSINPSIIKANCFAHVLHNASKYAFKIIPPKFDLDVLVNKCYAEFSCSTAKTRELKKCFNFFDINYISLSKNVLTRWLSLHGALSKLIHGWQAVKQYFIGLGEDHCDPFIWEFLKDQQDEISDIDTQPSYSELYLHMYFHFLKLMTDAITLLQSNNLTPPEVHDIITNLKDQAQERINQKFFGSTLADVEKHMGTDELNKFYRVAGKVYERALKYLSDYYSEDCPMATLSVLNIKKDKLVYNDVLKAAELLNVSVDKDDLFSEIVVINKKLAELRKTPTSNLQMWKEILQKIDNIIFLRRIMEKVFSIPVSQAFIERIFSIMESTWSKERNLMKIDLVKAELAVNCNFSLSCRDFYNYLKDPKNKQILVQAKDSAKYVEKDKNVDDDIDEIDEND